MYDEGRRAKTWHVRSVVLAAVFLLGSCARQGPVSAVTLRIAGIGPFENLSPLLDGNYSVALQGLVYSQILEPRQEGGWRSQVLREWVRLDGGRYRLKVEPSARFSDGTVVRNEDVIASLVAFGIRGTEQEDGWLEIEPMESGAPIDPLLLRAYLFKQGADGPLGTGSFAVVTQDTERILLHRVKPLAGRITQVELVAYVNKRDAFAAALRGEADALLMLDAGEIELLEGVPRFQVVRAPALHAITALFNGRRLGREERKVLAEAIPILDVARAVGGDCEPQIGQPQLVSIPPSRPLEVHISEPETYLVRVGLALRRALGARGGSAGISAEPTLISKQRMTNGLFDIMVMRLQVWPPPSAALFWRTAARSNFARYSNPAVDQALESGDYQRAQLELNDDPPAISICRMMRSAAIDVRVKNPRLGPYDLLETLPEWEVNP